MLSWNGLSRVAKLSPNGCGQGNGLSGACVALPPCFSSCERCVYLPVRPDWECGTGSVLPNTDPIQV